MQGSGKLRGVNDTRMLQLPFLRPRVECKERIRSDLIKRHASDSKSSPLDSMMTACVGGRQRIVTHATPHSASSDPSKLPFKCAWGL